MSDATMSLAALRALPIHPAAAAFPYISDDEIMALADDIEANGLIHPIVLIDGEILDGRNRLAALAKTKLTQVPVTEFPGGDPVQYVISLNVHRRHLDTYQWVEAAAKLAPLFAGRHGGDHTSEEASASRDALAQGKTSKLVAEQLHGAVSQATLERGWKLMDLAPEQWTEAKRTGTKVYTAYKAAFEAQPQTNKDVVVERTGSRGQIERVTVKREALFLEVLESIANKLVDARRAAEDFMAQANDEDTMTAHKLATRIARLAQELEEGL